MKKPAGRSNKPRRCRRAAPCALEVPARIIYAHLRLIVATPPATTECARLYLRGMFPPCGGDRLWSAPWWPEFDT